jgi:hypothetical protein
VLFTPPASPWPFFFWNNCQKKAGRQSFLTGPGEKSVLH